MATQRCTACGTRFDGRADARYCCAACRQGDYRERKRRGPRMTDAALAAKVAELATLAGELEDELRGILHPGTRPARPMVMLDDYTVDDRTVRLARRGSDNMHHVANYLSRIRNEARKRGDDDAGATVVPLRVVERD